MAWQQPSASEWATPSGGGSSSTSITATITASSTQSTLAAIQTTISPSGGTSYTYVGALTRPTGSSAALDATNTANPSFTPDKPGIYTVELTATDVSTAFVTKVRTQEVKSDLSIALSSTSSSQNNLNAVSTTITPTGGLGAITYLSVLTSPTGATTTVNDSTTTTPSFTPDKAGGYRLTVTATDAAGQAATATRMVEVGTATLSVSIAAISDQTGLTGTITCDSTVTNMLGSPTYSWSGEKPDGSSITFSDAATADPTITLSDDDVPGNYTATCTVTDSARRESVSASRSFRVGDVTDGAIRSILISVVGGVLGWQEQQLIGGLWRDISAHAALTTETDGGVTFADTTMTIPLGIAVATTPYSCPDERYMAFSSASATFQAMITAGAQWKITSGETSMETTLNARWGWSLASVTGTYDASGDNIIGVRVGHNGTAYALNSAPTNASYNAVATAAALGPRKFTGAMETATSGSWYWAISPDKGAFSPGTAVCNRLYITASATALATLATTAVVAPWVRFSITPSTL